MVVTREPDPMLRRFERNQVVATLLMAAVPAVFGRFDVVLGVLAGGALMAASYHAIKGSVDTILRKGVTRPAIAGAKTAGRYALLVLAAYVMLVCLRAHPVGLLVGAMSPVVAVALEALRVVRAWSRPGHPR